MEFGEGSKLVDDDRRGLCEGAMSGGVVRESVWERTATEGWWKGCEGQH